MAAGESAVATKQQPTHSSPFLFVRRLSRSPPFHQRYLLEHFASLGRWDTKVRGKTGHGGEWGSEAWPLKRESRSVGQESDPSCQSVRAFKSQLESLPGPVDLHPIMDGIAMDDVKRKQTMC